MGSRKASGVVLFRRCNGSQDERKILSQKQYDRFRISRPDGDLGKERLIFKTWRGAHHFDYGAGQRAPGSSSLCPPSTGYVHVCLCIWR